LRFHAAKNGRRWLSENQDSFFQENGRIKITDWKRGKKILEMAGMGKVPCSDCQECPVQCTMNFNVRDKILDIARLTHVPDEFLLT